LWLGVPKHRLAGTAAVQSDAGLNDGSRRHWPDLRATRLASNKKSKVRPLKPLDFINNHGRLNSAIRRVFSTTGLEENFYISLA
jgi:hypothetical protein